MDPILPDISRPLPVVIDTDPAGGIFLRDIDDVLAILFLLASPEVKVDALTVTYGNASLKKTLKVAHRICAVTSRQDIPVFPGASSAKDRGRKTLAARFLIDYFREHAGRAALLTLGPLTNLATALKIEPRLKDWIGSVVIMGGNLSAPFPLAPYSGFEFNTASDAVAVKTVLGSGLNIWIATADLCMQARFGPAELKGLRLKNISSAADRLCDIDQWIRLNRLVLSPRGFVPWDPVAAVMLVYPQLYGDVRALPLSMNTRGLKRRLILDPETGPVGARCIVPLRLDAPRFLDALVDRLSQI